MYALQQGMGLMKTHPAEKAQISAIILPLFDNLEKQKAALDTRSEALRPAVLRVAMAEFEQADQADRASRWDKVTASKFNNADMLLEVMSQFGAVDAEVNLASAFWRTWL